MHSFETEELTHGNLGDCVVEVLVFDDNVGVERFFTLYYIDPFSKDFLKYCISIL